LAFLQPGKQISRISGKIRFEEGGDILREFVNRVRMNLGAAPAVNSFTGPDEENRQEEACPHRQIYSAGDPARIDFAAFLKDLAGQSIPPGLIRINFQNIFLGKDTAVYCGFIFKELLAHFIELKQEGKGLVNIDLTRQGDVFTLDIAACGSRFGLRRDFPESESLSARLIKFLAQQINGTIVFDRRSSQFRLSFRETGLLESLQL
jgi:two-component sensor histidine kinase